MTLVGDFIDFLHTTPEIRALVEDGIIGSSPSYQRGFIFENKPYVNLDKKNHSSVLVIYSNSPWSPPRRASGLEYPLMEIEIWAAPTKNPDGTQAEDDAAEVIDQVYRALKPYIHLVHASPANGVVFNWGNTSIVSSEILDGPIVRPVAEANGAKVGAIGVGIQK